MSWESDFDTTFERFSFQWRKFENLTETYLDWRGNSCDPGPGDTVIVEAGPSCYKTPVKCVNL